MPLPVCKRNLSVLTNDTLRGDAVVVIRMACKSWSCKACAARKRNRWRTALSMQLPAVSTTWTMHTVTIANPYPHDARAAAQHTAQVIRTGWEPLIKRLKRRLGRFSYVRALEYHKSGALHVHVLISAPMPPDEEVDKEGIWAWGRENAPQLGFGWRYHVLGIPSGAAVGYVTKYLTKVSNEQGRAMSSHRVRRIQTTRDIKAPASSASEERWVKRSLITLDEVYDERHYLSQESRYLTDDDYINPDGTISPVWPKDSDVQDD